MRSQDLSWSLPLEVAPIKIRIRANQGKIISPGNHILVGVVKVELLLLHGRRDGFRVCSRNSEDGDLAGNENIGNEKVDYRIPFTPAEDHT